MQPPKLAAAALGLALAISLPGQGQPVPKSLRRPGETIMFSFVTKKGKTVVLCEGHKGAYLVYRFGTAAKVELQYPAVLDACSWKKFTYSLYFRGGGLANGGHLDASLSFRNGNVTYKLYDTGYAEAGERAEEYPRAVSMHIFSSSAGFLADIEGNELTAKGGIIPNGTLRQRATRGKDSF